MAAFAPPAGPDPGIERPLICLSNADGTCPQKWLEIFKDSFEAIFKVEVSVNYPFKGGFIIRAHASEVPWLQVGLSRTDFLTFREKGKKVLEALRRALLSIQ